MFLFIHCFITLCILALVYRNIICKIKAIYEDIQKIKEEHYFTSNNADKGIHDSDHKLQMLKVDVIELENKFYNLQNFYNKRIQVVYRDIYDIKHISDKNNSKSVSFDIEA